MSETMKPKEMTTQKVVGVLRKEGFEFGKRTGPEWTMMRSDGVQVRDRVAAMDRGILVTCYVGETEENIAAAEAVIAALRKHGIEAAWRMPDEEPRYSPWVSVTGWIE